MNLPSFPLGKAEVNLLSNEDIEKIWPELTLTILSLENDESGVWIWAQAENYGPCFAVLCFAVLCFTMFLCKRSRRPVKMIEVDEKFSIYDSKIPLKH